MSHTATWLPDDVTFTKMLTLHHKIGKMPEDAYDPSIFDKEEKLILVSYGLSIFSEECPDQYEELAEHYEIEEVEMLAGFIAEIANQGDEPAQDIVCDLMVEGANYFANLKKHELPSSIMIH